MPKFWAVTEECLAHHRMSQLKLGQFWQQSNPQHKFVSGANGPSGHSHSQKLTDYKRPALSLFTHMYQVVGGMVGESCYSSSMLFEISSYAGGIVQWPLTLSLRQLCAGRWMQSCPNMGQDLS